MLKRAKLRQSLFLSFHLTPPLPLAIHLTHPPLRELIFIRKQISKKELNNAFSAFSSFFISYVCLSAKPIDNMLRYVNGDKQYQFHDLTVDVEPGHIYSKTGQLRFRTWTNNGKIIRLDSFITTTVITIRERYRLLLHCSVIQGTINNAMHYYTIHLNAKLYHSRQCSTIQCDTTHFNA